MINQWFKMLGKNLKLKYFLANTCMNRAAIHRWYMHVLFNNDTLLKFPFSDTYTCTYIKHVMCLYHMSSNFPDSMTTLGQRWETVEPLANGWLWVHNVRPTLGQHQHVLYEFWKATPFILCWLYNVRPKLGQHKELRW